jgi:hypothetical protein
MMVTTNIGTLDAGLRAFLGAMLLGVSAAYNDRPLLAVGAGFLALVLLGTALFRTCPLYTLLGINTCRQRAHPG